MYKIVFSSVLPDMIGGNGYNDQLPSLELMIRWTQANTFMPAMQFSYLPMDFGISEVTAVVTVLLQQCVALHKNYSAEIIEAMQASVENGTPVNPPIWWIDPTDPVALATDDGNLYFIASLYSVRYFYVYFSEYLLGEKILVAPVIEEGATTRNVYLPKGTWKDGNSDTTYEGPITIEDYSATLFTFPYFIKQ